MNSNLFILSILLWPFALLAETNEIIDQPIEAIESSLYQMEILVNSGAYMDAQGRMVTDIYEGSESFLAISVTNGNDTPVLGVKPTFLWKIRTQCLYKFVHVRSNSVAKYSTAKHCI